MKKLTDIVSSLLTWLLVAAAFPLLELALTGQARFAGSLRSVFIFAILAIGLNVVTGYTGLLNLGVAAFMAIGAYTYSILTCAIYPFQLGFWLACFIAVGVGAVWGVLLGLPTIRLKGDYLTIVTLGFGEIIQDILKNLEAITKGTQGINPLPGPQIFGYQLTTSTPIAWYYLLLFILCLVVLFVRNLESAPTGRSWLALREDELAAASCGINPIKVKLLAFLVGASLASLAGALSVALIGSSGEPGNYDFQVSVMVLCIIIVGGLGSMGGVLLGSFIIVLFNNVFLNYLAALVHSYSSGGSSSVFAAPDNWKYLILGLALVLMMRFRPAGILPAAHRQI